MDALIAARMVGPEGEVVGIDVTPQMVTKARRAAGAARVSNVRFVEGLAEALPVSDATVDVVISNGAINLIPEKPAVFGEMFRVLRPGGKVLLVDLLAARDLDPFNSEYVRAWVVSVHRRDALGGEIAAAELAASISRAARYRLIYLYGAAGRNDDARRVAAEFMPTKDGR